MDARVNLSCKYAIDFIIFVEYLQSGVSDNNLYIVREDASQHTEVITQPCINLFTPLYQFYIFIGFALLEKLSMKSSLLGNF